MKIRSVIAWVATLTVLGLALWPGVEHRWLGGPPSVYSAETALLTAALITVIWYLHWTHEAVRVPMIRRQVRDLALRGNFATALLAELQWLDNRLRFTYEWHAWRYQPYLHPILDHALSHLDLFDAPTIDRLATFHCRIRDVVAVSRSWREAPEAEREQIERILMLRTQLACAAIVPLVQHLRRMGGQEPAPDVEMGSRGKLPGLPPRPFGGPNVEALEA